MGSIRAMWLATFVAMLSACSGSVTPNKEDASVDDVQSTPGDGDSGDGDTGDGDTGDGDTGDGDTGDGDSGDGDTGDGDTGDGDDPEPTCDDLDCADSAECDDSGDEPVCRCPAGYEDTKGDASECVVTCDSLKCMAPATCDESGDTPACKCPAGYDDVNGDGSKCDDIDECADANLNDCARRANCTNTAGGFTCECRSPRYTGDGKTCTCAEGYEVSTADATRCVASNGTTCSDDLDCASESCVGGTCCSNLCNAPGTCQTTDGATCSDGATCFYPQAPQGAECDDGDACTADTCDANGACQGVKVPDDVLCTQGGACKSPSCDPVLGCTYSNVDDDVSCDDGNPCTTTDSCQAGACVGGGDVPAACNDNNECTDNVCAPVNATEFTCSNPDRDGSCAAPNACATGGTCMAGLCQPTGNACGAGDPECNAGPPKMCICDEPLFVLDTNTGLCKPNVDECQTNNPCDPAGICVDNDPAMGNAVCSCPADLVGDGYLSGSGCAPCTGTYTKAVNNACVCELTGTFAFRVRSELSWAADSTSGLEGANGVVTLGWSLVTLDYTGAGDLTWTQKACGGTTPESCLEGGLFEFEGEAWSGDIDPAVWDGNGNAAAPVTRPPFRLLDINGGAVSAVAGQPFRAPTWVTLAGLKLESPLDPLTYWPATRSVATPGLTWDDADGNGLLGITTQWKSGTESSVCPRGGGDPYDHAHPVSLNFLTAERVQSVYGASRLISSLNGEIVDCNVVTGTVNGSNRNDLTSYYETSARVLGCRRATGTNCTGGMIDFLDGVANENAPSVDSATFVLKRMPVGPTDPAPTCAEVRAFDYTVP